MTSQPTGIGLSPGARKPISKELRSRLQPIIEKAQADQIPAYLAGGCVRDLLVNRPPKDIDVVVEGLSESFARSVARAYKAKLIGHPPFLTYTLQFSKTDHIDLASARTETYAEPGALPVVEPASLQEDLYRRDFSINAMALSLNPADFGHVWDPFGGLEDLEAGKIRVLHSESFKDDPTRIFRAARFAARFGFEVEWRTREWLMEAVAMQLPSRISGARLREELVALLAEDDPRPAFRLLDQWGALTALVPALKWEKNHEAFFGGLSTKKLPDSQLVRLLILVHAIPFSKAVGCLGHLMFPQAMIEQIEQVLHILSRLRDGTLTPKDSKLNPRRALPPEVKRFIERASRLRSSAARKEPEMWKRFDDCIPCLSGRDIRELGYKPGPLFTKILDALRQARWEGKLRTREEEIRFLMHAFPLHGC